MKRIVMLAAAVLFAAAPLAGAADKTWNGTISDSKCGAKHPGGEHDGKKMTDADCTKACVEGGAKYVFISGGKTYQIANQDYAGLKDHAGHKVALSGEMADNSITVSKIEMPAANGGAKKK